MILEDIIPTPPVFSLQLTHGEAQELFNQISKIAWAEIQGTALMSLYRELGKHGIRRSPGIIPAEGMEKMK